MSKSKQLSFTPDVEVMKAIEAIQAEALVPPRQIDVLQYLLKLGYEAHTQKAKGGA